MFTTFRLLASTSEVRLLDFLPTSTADFIVTGFLIIACTLLLVVAHLNRRPR